MASTLYEYYKSIGQGLPSISDRAQLYQSKGLGSASEYRGTADQNTRLLSSLSGGGTPSPQTTTTAGGTASVASPAGGSLAGYIPYAQDVYEKVYGPVQKTYEDWAATIPGIFQKQREPLEASIPLIQQRYKGLLDELVAKDVETQADIKEQGEAAVGETRARAGARGMFSSGVETAQEANIGKGVAKLIKSQAEGTTRRKQEYTTMQGEEENNIRKLLNDLAVNESEAGFKIREAIAKLGPEKLESAISLAGKIISDIRAGEELDLKKKELSAKLIKSGAETANIANVKNAIAGWQTLPSIVSQYGDKVDPDTIYSLYNSFHANDEWGPAKESPSQLYSMGIKPYEGLAEEGATTADAIDQALSKGTRESALQELNIKESSWRDAGVDTSAVRNAIETRFPAPKTSGKTSSDSSNFWDSFWTELTMKPHWV